MRLVLTLLAHTFAGAALLIACSGSSDAPPPSSLDDGGVDPKGDAGGRSVSPDIYAVAICKHLEKCNPIYFRHTFATTTTCTAKLKPRTAAALNAPGNIVTAAQLEACTSRLNNSCDDYIGSLPECEFVGTQPDGAGCAFSGQCAGAECVGATPTECGKCGVLAGGGMDCSKVTCRAPFACADGRCVARGDEGNTCSSAAPCKDTLTCVEGECKRRPGNAAPCDPNRSACDPTQSLVCVPTQPGESTGTCQPQLFAKLDEACGLDSTTGITTECEGSACSKPGEKGTCVPFLADGADCGETLPACDYALGCVKGKCQGLDTTTCN